MSQWSFPTNCRGWAICKSSDLSPVLRCMCIWYMPVCAHTEAKGSTLGALLYWPPSLFSEFPGVHVSVGGACGGSREDTGLSGAVSCELCAENQTLQHQQALNCWASELCSAISPWIWRSSTDWLASKPQGLPHLCPSSRCHARLSIWTLVLRLYSSKSLNLLKTCYWEGKGRLSDWTI